MKAIVQTAYGSPEVLQLRNIDKPTVQDDDVLVRVDAAALTAGDYFIMRGVPVLVRPSLGLLRPKKRVVTGWDVAGHVEAIGKNVTQLRPGDEVFGACTGTCAEYACGREDRFALKPVNLTSNRPRPCLSRRSPRSRLFATRLRASRGRRS